MINTILRHSAAKPLVFVACLLPLAWLAWRLFGGGPQGGAFAANPQEYLNRYLGDWALRALLATLALTPLGNLTGARGFVRFRRMLGLYGFFYVCLHLTSYTWLDQGFYWPEIWKDITKRTYITIGMASFILLIPLAATSWNRITQRLGSARWRRLHQVFYVIAPLACLHFFMMRKGIQLEPIIYVGICGVLLGLRLFNKLKAVHRATP
jgi:sulfoxide reductase heme-binding subunit YedZ